MSALFNIFYYRSGVPRAAKYNRLLRIEEELAAAARFPGYACF